MDNDDELPLIHLLSSFSPASFTRVFTELHWGEGGKTRGGRAKFFICYHDHVHRDIVTSLFNVTKEISDSV